MKGHLFLHLGPPKTATTSLQIALQSLDLPNFVYLGAHQPRDPSVTHPSDLIHAFCLHESAALSGELEMLVTTIHKRLEQGGTVVLSEEGFLVWEERAHFWEKLARLEQLFSELPHTYIITVRDPKDALPSYYQELYPRLSVAEKLRPEQFFEHGRCDCYDYQKLKSWFDQRGLAVRLLDFTRLASGSLSLRELLGSACSHDSTLAIPLANAGRRGNDGDDVNSRILPAITLAELSSIGLFRRCKAVLRQISPWLFRLVKRLTGKFPFRRPKARRIVVPKARLLGLSEAFERIRSQVLSQAD